MKIRKAFTLLEIMVAMSIMGIITFTGWSILTNVVSHSAKGVGSAATQTEAKHIVETMVTIVRNASELEILDSKPGTFDGESKYLYTENGVVHYFDGIEDIVINVSNNDNNELTFSGTTGEKILEYEIKSIQGKEEYSSNSSVILNNLENGIDNKTTSDDKSGHCIRFKAEDDIALIVEFNFLKVNNTNIFNTFVEDYIGYVADGYIEIWVPTGTDVGNLYPSVKFFGDKVVIPDNYHEPLADPADAVDMDGVDTEKKYELVPEIKLDFSEAVYCYVVRNDIVKEYKVVVKPDTEETKVKIGQEKAPPTWEEVEEENKDPDKTIVFNEDFIAYVNNSNNVGEYAWYVQGVEKPIKKSSSNTLTVEELANHNNKAATKIEGGIDDTKYDKDNPNDNEDAMLYLMVKFTPQGAEPDDFIASDPVLVYPVIRNDLWKEFDDFYFKIATDVWVKSRLLENEEEDKDINTGKTGADMADDFMKWYKANTKTTYDPESVKLNDKKGDEMSKTKYTPDSGISYADVTASAKFGYDKAPDLIRTMYKMELVGNKYKIVPTIFTYGDNTTSEPSQLNGGSFMKQADSPYSRTAFSIDVEYFMNNVNNLKNRTDVKISNISSVDMYEFEVTYKPGNLESVNTRKLDVAEKMDIKKLAIGVFTDRDGNGFRYMTGSGAEPQLPDNGYLKVIGQSGINTSGWNSIPINTNNIFPTESANVYLGNYLQEYVLSDSLKSPESITMKVNTVRHPVSFYQSGLEQGKSINTYVKISKNGTPVEGELPTPENTGMRLADVNYNLFTSYPASAGLMLGESLIMTLTGGLTVNQTVIGSGYSQYGFGMPCYVGTDYGKSYEEMLIGEDLYSAGIFPDLTGNSIRTNTTKLQANRTFGNTTMGNYITIGSANDSHTASGTQRSTAGDNAKISLEEDQYAHYISDFKLSAGYESEPIEVESAKIIGNITINNIPATVIEMEFNKPIRGGYGPEIYKEDGETPAHIDTEILNYLESNIGKNISSGMVTASGRRLSTLDAYYPIGGYPYTMFTPNINARDISIRELKADGSMGTQTYGILKPHNAVLNPVAYPDRKGAEHYIYKTGEKTLVAIIEGTLDSEKTYGIEFKRGAVQAMKLGAVPIENGKIEPAKIKVELPAWDAIQDVLSGGEVMDEYNTQYSNFNLKPEEGAIEVYATTSPYYVSSPVYLEDSLRTNVNMTDGFVVTVTAKKDTAYNSNNPQGFHAFGVYNSDSDTGYALIMNDKTQTWGDSPDTQIKANFSIMAIRNHQPVDKNGNIVDSSNQVIIGGSGGKVYYDRQAGQFYKYEATFKGTTVTLKVFKVLSDGKEEQVGNEVVVNIPAGQYTPHKDLEFDTMDLQTDHNITTYKELSINYLQN